jgi:hypothetical protein
VIYPRKIRDGHLARQGYINGSCLATLDGLYSHPYLAGENPSEGKNNRSGHSSMNTPTSSETYSHKYSSQPSSPVLTSPPPLRSKNTPVFASPTLGGAKTPLYLRHRPPTKQKHPCICVTDPPTEQKHPCICATGWLAGFVGVEYGRYESPVGCAVGILIKAKPQRAQRMLLSSSLCPLWLHLHRVLKFQNPNPT